MTVRTYAELIALYADNTSGAISAEDLRDFVDSIPSLASKTGVATLDFGAFPGGSDAKFDITGQSGIVSGSIVEVWLRPEDTADHTADEHVIETLRVMAGNIIPGTGFTIYGVNSGEINEPVEPIPSIVSTAYASATTIAERRTPAAIRGVVGGRSTRIWGQWRVQWRWS